MLPDKSTSSGGAFFAPTALNHFRFPVDTTGSIRKLRSGVVSLRLFKIKSPGLIRSEGRPVRVNAKTPLRFAFPKPESKAGNSAWILAR